MRKTPSAQQVEQDIANGKAAVAYASNLRKQYRRTSNPGGERQPLFEEAITRCKYAARPIRRHIGMLPYHEALQPYDFELRAVSAALTYERRRLRKMLR